MLIQDLVGAGLQQHLKNCVNQEPRTCRYVTKGIVTQQHIDIIGDVLFFYICINIYNFNVNVGNGLGWVDCGNVFDVIIIALSRFGLYTMVKKTRQLWRTITTTQFSRF